VETHGTIEPKDLSNVRNVNHRTGTYQERRLENGKPKHRKTTKSKSISDKDRFRNISSM
jgi:hypothetical protein